jgi:hypothetical protein
LLFYPHSKDNVHGEGTNQTDKKKTINFLGIRTTTDRLLQSSTEDINFVADWLYVEWIHTNACSSSTIKTAVVALIVVTMILYAVEASDGRLIQCCFNKCGVESFGKRTYVILMLLLVLEGIPQIAITVVGEGQLLEDNCSVEFASQAFSNLFTSTYVIFIRILKMYECRDEAKEVEEEEEIVVHPDSPKPRGNQNLSEF